MYPRGNHVSYTAAFYRQQHVLNERHQHEGLLSPRERRSLLVLRAGSPVRKDAVYETPACWSEEIDGRLEGNLGRRQG